MNAPYDFSMLNAVKKVGAVLVKNPGGLQISQLTGMAKLSTKTTKKALAELQAICEEDLWYLPEVEPAVPQEPATPASARKEKRKPLTKQLVKLFKAHRQGLTAQQVIKAVQCTNKQFYSSLSSIRRNHFPVSTVKQEDNIFLYVPDFTAARPLSHVRSNAVRGGP